MLHQNYHRCTDAHWGNILIYFYISMWLLEKKLCIKGEDSHHVLLKDVI